MMFRQSKQKRKIDRMGFSVLSGGLEWNPLKETRRATAWRASPRSAKTVNVLLASFGVWSLLLIEPAFSQERKEVGTSGDWQILVDSSSGNGCLMRRQQDDGIVVEVGVVPKDNGAYFAAYHSDWTGLVVGETFPIEFHFEDTGFGGDAVGVEQDGMLGGYAYFNNMALLDEFAKRNTATVIGPRGGKGEISLSGTSKAIAAVRSCQENQEAPSE